MLNRWGGQPLPINASRWLRTGRLRHVWLRLSRRRGGGRWRPARTARRRALRRGRGTQRFWRRRARADSMPYFAAHGARAPVAPVGAADGAACSRSPARQLIEWGGAQRWLAAPRPQARTHPRCRAQVGGHATLFRAERRPTPGQLLHAAAPRRWRASTARLKRAVRSGDGVFNPAPRCTRIAFVEPAACRPNSPRIHRTRPTAARPRPSCASACIAASAPPPARPTSCSATNSTGRAAAST